LEFVLPQGGFAAVRAIRRGEVFLPCSGDGRGRVLFIVQASEFGFCVRQLGDNGFQGFRLIGHGEGRMNFVCAFFRLAAVVNSVV